MAWDDAFVDETTPYSGVGTKLNKSKMDSIIAAIAARITKSGSVTDGHAAVFDGATGLIVKDGGVLGTGDVVGPAGATDGAMALYDTATGKLLKNGVSPNTPKRSIWLSGAGGWPSTTQPNGGFVTSEFAVVSDASNNFRGTKFVASVSDTSQNYGVVMPLNWNGGTITATPWFHTTSTGTSGTCIFGVRAGGYDNSDNMTVALGTGVTSTFTFESDLSGKFLKGPTTSAITVAGTSTGGEYVQFVVYRAGSDTFAGDVILIGVLLSYTTDNFSDE